MPLDPRPAIVHALLRHMVRRDTRPPTVEAYLEAKRISPDPHEPPGGRAAAGLAISQEVLAGTPTYRLAAQPPGSGAFVYLHGGSYIGQINPGQWKLVMGLARDSGATGLVPISPLAPEETADRTVPRAAAVIAAAMAEHGPDRVSVLGDSAGGGVAVSAVQQLRDEGADLPRQLVLLAPWLDLSLTHPDQASIAPHDILARRDYLLAAARVFAGDLPIDDWRVSPLHGDLASLPPLHVFTGSHDSIATDSRELVTRVRAAGGLIEYQEAPGMQHVYPVLPLLGEAKAAKRQIAALLA